jgi:hypothetical protein
VCAGVGLAPSTDETQSAARFKVGYRTPAKIRGAASCRIYAVSAGVLAAAVSGVAAGAESAASVSGTTSTFARPRDVASSRPSSAYDRVVERRRGLSIAQIADRLGRSPATVKAYFYDPTGAKARAVKARYVGVCRGCGAYTQPRNGKGDAYAYCKRCHPGAIQRLWTRERVLEAMGEWLDRYGRLPTSYDWSRMDAGRRGRGATPSRGGRVAAGERGHLRVRELGGGA